MRPARGFTLIEVIIAVLVVALGIGALLTALASSARVLGDVRDRSLAEWIALNRISEVRLTPNRPGTGTTDGTLEYAGLEWRWEQQVTDPGVAGMLRIDVHVALADAPDMPRTPAPESDDATTTGPEGPSFAPLATAYGFIGTAVARASGIDPDWSFAAARRANQPDGERGGPDGERQPPGEEQGPSQP